MRKLIMLSALMLMLLAVPTFGQISVTNSFAPTPGTILRTKVDNTLPSTFYDSLTSGSGGPMTWDFSSRHYGADFLTTVVSVATTPGSDSFPQSNFALRVIPIAGDTSWTFYRTNASMFWQLGSYTSGIYGTQFIAYRDSSPDWVFPMTYNSQWISHRKWTSSNTQNHSDVLDTVFNVVDAWGTVKYNTTSMPCLRVTSHTRQTSNTYKNSNDSLINTFVSETFMVSFVVAGYSQVETAIKAPSASTTTYSGTASSDFVNQHTGVTEERTGNLPKAFSVEQNYPNPFNPSTQIRFNLPARSDVLLTVYNIDGQQIKTLVDKQLGAGTFIADWDGTNQAGVRVASGVYLYRLDAGTFSESKKMVLLK